MSSNLHKALAILAIALSGPLLWAGTLTPLAQEFNEPRSMQDGELQTDEIEVGTATRFQSNADDISDTLEVIVSLSYKGTIINKGSEADPGGKREYIAFRMRGEFSAITDSGAFTSEGNGSPNFSVSVQPLSAKEVKSLIGKNMVHAMPVSISYDASIGEGLNITADVIGVTDEVKAYEVGPVAFLIGTYITGLGFQQIEYLAQQASEGKFDQDQTNNGFHIVGGNLMVSAQTDISNVKVRLGAGIAGDYSVAKVKATDNWENDVSFAPIAQLTVGLSDVLGLSDKLDAFVQWKSTTNPLPGQSYSDADRVDQVTAGFVYHFSNVPGLF